MAAIAEAYEHAGVVHGDNCQVCTLEPLHTRERKHRIKKAFNILLIILLIGEAWLLIYHLDWVVGGLPQ